MSDNETFDVEAMVMSGAPVEFEIDGERFALRQMTPAERDKLSKLETMEHDRVLAEYRAAGLGDQPMSDELQDAKRVYMAALEDAYIKAIEDGDQEAALQAARDMEDGSMWPRSLAHERANTFVSRLDGRWMADNLLDGDRAEFVKLTRPDPLLHDAVIEAVAKLRQLSQYVPNFNGRRQ